MTSRLNLTECMSCLDPEEAKEAIKFILEGAPTKPCGVRSIAGRLELLQALLHPELVDEEVDE